MPAPQPPQPAATAQPGATVADCLAALEIGEPVTAGALTMLPLLTDAHREPLPRTLDQGLADASVHVHEVDPGGHVPELLVLNEGGAPLLLVHGEELIGGKQNRVLDATCLVPPRSRLRVPVSCVEAGRWRYSRHDFAASGGVLYARNRATTLRDVSVALCARGVHAADQSSVWDDIAERSERLGVRSATGAAAALYESRAETLDQVGSALRPQARQVGAVFQLGDATGLELFESPAILEALLPKLARSWALESLATTPNPPKATRRKARAFLAAAARAALKAPTYESLGLGIDLRLESRGLAGAALLHEGQLVHLAAYKGF